MVSPKLHLYNDFMKLVPEIGLFGASG